TGASGNIGSKITAILLYQGYKVRVLSRKAYPAVLGIEVFNGDINDDAVLKNFMHNSQMLFHCAADFPAPVYAESAILAAQVTAGQYRKEAVRHAEEVLGKAARKLEGTGLTVDTLNAVNDLPYEAIINAAAKKKCDLIVMASHGRRGLSGFLLGSETQKVLTHSKVPVLVVR
ncbi:MAG: universal stress protein, partial [Verrucomicrobiota bacterium]